MPQYIVPVSRIAYASKDIHVNAESPQEAMRLAEQEAGNHVFSEKSAEYQAQTATEVPES